MMYLFTFIAIWLLCGFVGAGFLSKYWLSSFPSLYSDKKYRFWSDWTDVWTSFLGGPMMLIVLFFTGSFRYGWKMPFTYKENK